MKKQLWEYTRIEGKFNSFEFYTSYKLPVSNIDFIMDYIFIVKDSFDNKRERIKSLKVIKASDEDTGFCYRQDMKAEIFIRAEGWLTCRVVTRAIKADSGVNFFFRLPR